MFKQAKLPSLTTSLLLALALGIAPVAGCSSSGGGGGAAGDEAGQAQEADEAIWVVSKETNVYVSPDGDKEEQVATYELDDAGNQVGITYDDGTHLTITVDEDGWQLSARYDNSEDISATDEPLPSEPPQKLEKDDHGRVTKITSQDLVIEYAYDEKGNMTHRSTRSLAFTVNEEGKRVEGSEVDITSDMDFDENGFTTRVVSSNGAGTIVSEYAYEYGESGLPVTGVITTRHEDSDGNVVEGDESTTNMTFSYDENGNISELVRESDSGTSTSTFEYQLVEHPSPGARVGAHLRF